MLVLKSKALINGHHSYILYEIAVSKLLKNVHNTHLNRIHIEKIVTLFNNEQTYFKRVWPKMCSHIRNVFALQRHVNECNNS